MSRDLLSLLLSSRPPGCCYPSNDILFVTSARDSDLIYPWFVVMPSTLHFPLIYHVQTDRGAIMIFLIMQLTISSLTVPEKLGVAGPWTEYVKFLPSVFLPTCDWTEEEQDLLAGTSLQVTSYTLWHLFGLFCRLIPFSASIFGGTSWEPYRKGSGLVREIPLYEKRSAL